MLVTQQPALILVVEDDEAIGSSLSSVLRGQGYEVEWQQTAQGALEAARRLAPDLVLLDLGLPDGDGVDVCRTIRTTGQDARIVILTARAEEIDIVLGLDAGADDYLTKPFRLSELLARVRAHLRGRAGSETKLTAGPIQMDLSSRRAWCGDVELVLRPREFDLLAILMQDAGLAVRRERIMSEVWGGEPFGSTKTLDTHIVWLRQKLAAAGAPDAISTLRRIGYRLEVE